jgi:hypothetical protein
MVQGITPSSRSATANAERDASQTLLSQPAAVAVASLAADGEFPGFRDVEDSGAQTLDLFAITTQEPYDRYDTMRPRPKSLRA